jgi:xanthosine utilization system XapX-like protein
MKVLFLPLSIASGLLAGLVGKKLFEQVWGLFDEEEPPSSKHREISVPKMVAALAIEGAIFRAVRGATDHAARRSFQRVTGSWPGEERPEPE